MGNYFSGASAKVSGQPGAQTATNDTIGDCGNIIDIYLKKKWDDAQRWWGDTVGTDKPVSWQDFVTALNTTLADLKTRFDQIDLLYKDLKIPETKSNADFAKLPDAITADLPTDPDPGTAPTWKPPTLTSPSLAGSATARVSATCNGMK